MDSKYLKVSVFMTFRFITRSRKRREEEAAAEVRRGKGRKECWKGRKRNQHN
jgi:hypothetical protein